MVPLHIRWSHAVLKGREHSDNKKPQADGDRFSLHQQTDIPASQHSDTVAKKGALLPTPTAPQPTSPGQRELWAQCSSNRHLLRSCTTVSENYTRIMPWAVKPQGWGKKTGSCLELPSPVQCCACSQLPHTEESLECKGKGKTEVQSSGEGGLRDGIQSQLKWDQLHGTSHLPLCSLDREENTIQPSQDQPVYLLYWNISPTTVSGIILFLTTPGQEDLDSSI